MSMGLITLFCSLGYFDCDMPSMALTGKQAVIACTHASTYLARVCHSLGAACRPGNTARCGIHAAANEDCTLRHPCCCQSIPHAAASMLPPLPASLCAVAGISLVATLVESLPVNQSIDDNLSVPGVAAFLGIMFLQVRVVDTAGQLVAVVGRCLGSPLQGARSGPP